MNEKSLFGILIAAAAGYLIYRNVRKSGSSIVLPKQEYLQPNLNTNNEAIDDTPETWYVASYDLYEKDFPYYAFIKMHYSKVADDAYVWFNTEDELIARAKKAVSQGFKVLIEKNGKYTVMQ